MFKKMCLMGFELQIMGIAKTQTDGLTEKYSLKPMLIL